MAVDTETLAEMFADQIDELVPTEATFRGQTINIRAGEAPQARTFQLFGTSQAQTFEALLKVEDADPAPAGGELVTIAGKSYKVSSVTPLPSITSPAVYRVTLALG